MNDSLQKKLKDLKEFYLLVKKKLQSKINQVLDGKKIKIPNDYYRYNFEKKLLEQKKNIKKNL